MRRFWVILGAVASIASIGCGELPTRPRLPSARQSLIASPELLEFESVGRRQELFREIAVSSQGEAGQKVDQYVLFPISQGTQWIAAPGFDWKEDLLSTSAYAGKALTLSDQGGDSWSTERRTSLQGLSEREAVELVARNLLALWKIKATGAVQVQRSVGAPYAAAYVDGILKVNPVFLYLTTSMALAPAAG